MSEHRTTAGATNGSRAASVGDEDITGDDLITAVEAPTGGLLHQHCAVKRANEAGLTPPHPQRARITETTPDGTISRLDPPTADVSPAPPVPMCPHGKPLVWTGRPEDYCHRSPDCSIPF
jgi:hypothetical protein